MAHAITIFALWSTLHFMKPYPLTDKDSIDLLMMGSVKAGFPSPAEEVREKLDLVKLLV